MTQSLNKQVAFTQLALVMLDLTLSLTRFDDEGGQRDRTTGPLFIDLTLSSLKFDDWGGHRNDGTWKQKDIGQIRSRQNHDGCRWWRNIGGRISEACLYKPWWPKGFSIWNHKYISFLVHLHTCARSTTTYYKYFNFFNAEIVFIRLILTYKDRLRAERIFTLVLLEPYVYMFILYVYIYIYIYIQHGFKKKWNQMKCNTNRNWYLE